MGTTGQSITLANSIIGVGILAMPFCFQQCGVLLATLILLTMGLVSRLCCYFLLKSAHLARRRNFEFLAFHVFGPAGKLAVEVGIIGFLMGTCIAYFVVVGDLGPQIIAKMFNINQSDILRTSIMVIVSLVCVLPLGLLRNVDSLSNVSAATIAFYFCLVMKVIAEATTQAFATDLRTRVEMWKPSGLLQCVPIFSMALFCQTQLFEIFESLPTISMEKMSVVTKNAINICTGVYFTLGLFGYIAFSSQKISGNILMSLSPTWASDVIKLGFVMSVAFSFPLIIFPCRASLYSFLYKKVHSSHHDHIINNSIPESTFRCITVTIIAVALFISLLLPNIELVLGLVGSTIGVLICIVFPATCFLNITNKNTNDRHVAKAVLVLGVLIMVLGTYANLQAAEHTEKFDERTITQERIDKMVEDFFGKIDKTQDQAVKPPSEVKPEIEKKADEQLLKEVKDSEVQPPNPIPPESQSNEVKKADALKSDNDKTIDRDSDKLIDKVSESHPKNLNKLNVINKEKNENLEVKDEKVVETEPKPVETLIEAPKPKDNIDKTQEKSDLIKQQQLIETIKQHGEEQKELIKEQKEILQEIRKTKDELKENKNEVDSSEAKKIAVESIQKIANMAIQSLSGVSDKPIASDDNKKAEPLEKIANEAVQEIAKKAVETMEAIKEIQEKPKEIQQAKVQNVQAPANPVLVQNIPLNQNIQPNQQVLNNQANINNLPVNQNAPQQINAIPQVHNIPSNNIVQPANANVQPIANIPLNVVNNVPSHDNNVPSNVQNQPEMVNNKPAVVSNQPAPSMLAADLKPNIEVPKELANNIGENQKPNVQVPAINVPQPNRQINIIQHPHSPDEPQSYKQGEDNAFKKNLEEFNKNMAQNVPIPIAMNGNNKIIKRENTAQNEIEVGKLDSNNNNNVQNNGANKLINNLPIVENIRHKREVVDCSDKNLIKPEDKEICNMVQVGNSANVMKISHEPQDILKPVDLNDVLQKQGLPVDELMHLRSLKSIAKKKR